MTDITITIPTLPTTDAEANHFAANHIQPYEVKEFWRDWRDGKDVAPWVEAAIIDIRAGAGDWSGHDSLRPAHQSAHP